MGVVDGIRGCLVPIHKKTERFLDNRIKEATAARTIIAILITALAMGLTAFFSTNGPESFASFYQGAILLLLYFLFLALAMALDIWIVREINQGTKMKRPSWINALYPYFIVLGAAMCLSTVFALGYRYSDALKPALDALVLLAKLAFAYSLLTLLLRLFNPTVIEFIQIFVVMTGMGLVFVFALGAVILAIVGSLSSVSQVVYTFPVISHPDGSFTIEYKAPDYQLPFYTFRGNAECNMTFPSGWQIATEAEYFNNSNFYMTYPNGTNGYRLVYQKSLWDSPTKKYVVFMTLPPEDNPEALKFIEGVYEQGLENEKNNWRDSEGFVVENVSMTIDNVTGSKIADVYKVAQNGSEVKHEATVELGNVALAEFYYYAPYGQDSDFYSIIDSINCGER